MPGQVAPLHAHLVKCSRNFLPDLRSALSMARLRHLFRQSVRAAISLTSRSHILNCASRSALDTGHRLL